MYGHDVFECVNDSTMLSLFVKIKLLFAIL